MPVSRRAHVAPHRVAPQHIVGQAAMTDNDKIELINAMVALRRYHDTVLLKDLGPSGK